MSSGCFLWCPKVVRDLRFRGGPKTQSDLASVLGDGHAFNAMQGSFSMTPGLIKTNEPIVMSGPEANSRLQAIFRSRVRPSIST